MAQRDDKLGALPRRGARTHKTRTEQQSHRLVVVRGELAGVRFSLPPEATVIGRSADAQVVIDDPLVSRRHAVIAPSDTGEYVVQDVGSSNGVYVNGSRVKLTALQSGDRVRVGSHTMLFTSRTDVEQQVHQQQRFETLGRLAAGTVHDFNNMLGVILANTDYALGALSPEASVDPEALVSLNESRSAVRRAHNLARRLLDFARSGESAYRSVDVCALCAEACKLLRNSTPQAIEIGCDAEGELFAMGDYAELLHALLNLLLNARDALTEEGVIRMRCASTTLDDQPAARIVVVDDGVGMDAPTLSRIFQPMFSTKERGYGLGLASVKEIVSAHGGTVRAESEPGAGTTFEVILPTVERGERGESPSSVPPAFRARRHRSGSVLVVDDEAATRRAVSRILKREGFTVIEAEDGRQAVQRYLEPERPPLLVVLDMDMPVLDGTKTLALLRTLDPDVRVLIFSGAVPKNRAELLQHRALEVLDKPASATELIGAVRRLITGSIAEDTSSSVTQTRATDDERR